MAWQEAKTDWTSTDCFNVEDYNRIIGNIAVLKNMAVMLYSDFDTADMGNEKTYSDYIYADEINAIEQNLSTICANTYPFAIGEERTYYPNQPAADYKEVNRIESACLLIYNNLLGQASAKRRLSFRIGRPTFGNRR